MCLGEWMSSRSAVVGIVLTVAAGAGALLGSEPSLAPRSSPTATAPVTESAGPEMISVHVAGMVLDPGVVRVPSGSLVADVIVAAGGAIPGAQLDLVNLASPVVDGGQIEVPGPGGAGPEPAGTGLVSLNTADAVELQSLPGVGPVLAERILAFREANGSFSVVEDLLEVTGIGESKLAAIRDLVSVP